MEEETRKFKLKINGKVIFDMEATGTKSVIDSFDEKVISDTFGIFHGWKKIGEVLLNEMQITAQTIFRDKKGRFIKPDIKIEEV